MEAYGYRCFIFYRHACQVRASRERIISNARHAAGDSDGGQTRAIFERNLSNTRHAVGDGDGGQARATFERRISNARHAVGDSCVFTSQY